MGKVVMPDIPKVPTSLPQCEMVLAIRKDRSEGVCTVIFVRDKAVLFIDQDGSLTHGSVGYFEEMFNIIRQYAEGETLSITV